MLPTPFKRGFTILELVAVLLIIGILSGLGAVTYSNLIATSQEEVAEAKVIGMAREAQGVLALTAATPGATITAEEIGAEVVLSNVAATDGTDIASTADVTVDTLEFVISVNTDGSLSATKQ